jgi:hypothetical protein
MLLIKTPPILAPVQAERLTHAIGQRALGSRVTLFLLGFGGQREVRLGIHSSNRLLEASCAELVARDASHGEIENGDIVWEQLMAAHQYAVYNLAPHRRTMRNNSQSYGWQRVDPVHTAYEMLADLPAAVTAGFALLVLPLPDHAAATWMSTFATGRGCRVHAHGVAAAYSWAATVRWPLLQRRAYVRVMTGQLALTWSPPRRRSLMALDELSVFWHPRYEEGLTR